MYYIDDNANIIVPKSVRPIIDYEETYLGNKEGANRQFRLGTLHIREYDDHYAVHRDKIDPRTDPLGHLLLYTPEYLIGIYLLFLLEGKLVMLSILGEKQKARNTELPYVMQ